MSRIGGLLNFVVATCCVMSADVVANEPTVAEVSKQLRELDDRVIVLGTVRQPPLASMLARDVEARLRVANQADRRAWDEVKTRADWEAFRDRRLQALRSSLGDFPTVPRDLKARVTRSLEGDGFRVENLVFESRPGLVVTANLYRPAKLGVSMPGIIICHSHQSTKHTTWRQDMAMTWARAGCVVLVPDHLGHGERRQHPFGDEGPHDYHFRYESGIQLHLVGESLMGWLAWDLMRGTDLLLSQKGIDPKRIILISEPAGGGDVAAVTAALDTRITGVMVQNFGGPEPETPYPLPVDAENSFDYASSGSFESTRNLRLSARDGFLPWMIVASAAPRHLIYYHEFYWDRENDPVWKRLQRIHGFYGATNSLTGLAGRGFVVGSAPENSHWLPGNRQLLYPVLERWFGIPNPKQEFSNRLADKELLCLTPEVRDELKPLPLSALVGPIGMQRSGIARRERVKRSAAENRNRLREEWTRLLGSVAPQAGPLINGEPLPREQLGQVTIERIHLQTEPGIVVPVLLFSPSNPKHERLPVVVAVSQHGKQAFLRQRGETIAELLASGVAICLPDLRGTGETSPGEERDRRSAATSLSSSELMLGQSLLGGRLRDLRSILNHLRTRSDLDPKRLALWGDSFAPINSPDRNFQVPHTTSDRPSQSEPLGGLVTLLAALFEDDVRAVYVRGGLSDFQSVLEGPFCYLPHDAVVPGVLKVGDLCDLTAALSPRPLWLARAVDGLNRAVSPEELTRRYERARTAYSAAGAQAQFQIGESPIENVSSAQWLTERLNNRPD